MTATHRKAAKDAKDRHQQKVEETVAAMSDEELLCGTCYPAGSIGKVAVLAERFRRFAPPDVKGVQSRNYHMTWASDDIIRVQDLILHKPTDNQSVLQRVNGRDQTKDCREILHRFGTHTNESE